MATSSLEPIAPLPRRVSLMRPRPPSPVRSRHPMIMGLNTTFSSLPSNDNPIDYSPVPQLERSAEEMSQDGSDIGEEIRRMNNMEKEKERSRTRSRENSIQNSQEGDRDTHAPLGRVGSGSGSGNHGPAGRSRSRTNSYANSIVDVNSSARWGGYSPGGFVTSPTASIRSGGSWTQTSANRVVSNTAKPSRLAQVVEPLQEGRPLDSPLAPSSASLYSQEQNMSRQVSQSSFARRYDAIAGQIEESLNDIPPTTSSQRLPDIHDHDQQFHHLAEHETPDRPHSTDTYQEAQLAFRDFDGVHFSPDTEEFVAVDGQGNELRRVSARTSSGSLLDAASLLRQPKARPISYAAPPPNDGMVYYPAPVPKMLNLPKRLSKLPSANVQAQRRSQMLKELPAGARQSAPWIPPIQFGEERAQSLKSHESVPTQRSGSNSASQEEQPRSIPKQRMSMANLPPQLRASVYFDQQSVPHDVEITSESAVATLDSILAASATAPVSVFTDHPYAGDVRQSVYAPEWTHHRKTTSTAMNLTGELSQVSEQKTKEKRRSSIGNLFRRKSRDLDGETDGDTKSRPTSRGSMLDLNSGGNKLRKRHSQLSLGDGLDAARDTSHSLAGETTLERRQSQFRQSGLVNQAANADEHPEEELRVPSGSRSVIAMSRAMSEAQQIDQDFQEREDEENLEDDEPIFVQPSTLLAELQVRKAQLKSRNRNAATAFPGGMHSTLLQLDAVEQINQKRRQKQRVALAWEDPQLRAQEAEQNDAEDDDVPLGVLFPSKDGLVSKKLGDSRDWNRPLGLMERRELEDSEPLSSRRSRLNPMAAPLKQMAHGMSQTHLAQTQADEEEDEEETLGQRSRRIKAKEALDAAISGVENHAERPLSTFAASVLDEFPEFNQDDESKQKRASIGSKLELSSTPFGEEETLGQRRARLKREREASGGVPQEGAASRPALRQSSSLANILVHNPIGQRAVGRHQQAAEGTLLHAANQQQTRHRQDLLDTNMRSASYTLDKPLVDSRPQTSADVSSGLLGHSKSRPANGAFGGGTYNNATGSAPPMDAFNGRPDPNTGLLGASRSRPLNGGFAGGVYNSTGGGPPMFSMPNNNAYFASPTAAMGYGAYGGNMLAGYSMQGMMPQQRQPSMMMNTPTYMALSGAPMPGMPAAGGYNPMMATYAGGLQHQMPGMEQPMEPNQRSAIDQWRMGIAQ